MSDFEAALLPDEQKQDLCKALLAEFGVTNARVQSNGEIIHGCPLPNSSHKDQVRNPTASLNYRKLTFNCLGCGNSGGLLWFIATCRRTTSTEAREWLQSATGLGGQVMDLVDLLAYLDALYAPDSNTPPPIPRMNEKVLAPWAFIHPYMTEIRKIPEQTLIDFKVGWDPEANRIIIPHWWDGSLVGWQSRRLSPSDPIQAKYKNTPDFPRDTTIYNYDRRRRRAVVVESPMSVLSKVHVLPSLEGTFGAKVTDRQVRLLQRHDHVVLCFDNDDAGWKATREVGEALSPFNTVWVGANPWAADLADVDDPTAVEIVEEAIPYSEWQPPTSLQPWSPREGVTA